METETTYYAAYSYETLLPLTALPCRFPAEILAHLNAFEVKISRERYYDLLRELFPAK